ncbi:MAG: aminotransferase class III-fold pyridoxal phosphate-dependent enzyme [Marinicella sp.]
MKFKASITAAQVASWLREHHLIEGKLTPLVGDVDLNFRCQHNNEFYTVKISQVDSCEHFAFEAALMAHLKNHLKTGLELPKPVLNAAGQWLTICQQHDGLMLVMRVLSWVDGTLMSRFKPHSQTMLNHLGAQTASLDLVLKGFQHGKASRTFSWDLAQCLWVKDHLDKFTTTQQDTLLHFIALFEDNQENYQKLKKQVIHNDLNDNNVLVTQNTITGFIDFGDVVHSQLINELAITCAYALMHKANPLSAATTIINGYQQLLPLEDHELIHLYHLIGMRLVVSVTHAAIAQLQDPENEYKSVSEQPAWDLLNLWQAIPAQIAYYAFRKACGMSAHPSTDALQNYLHSQKMPLATLFPDHDSKSSIHTVDLSVASTLLGGAAEYEDHAQQKFKILQTQEQHPDQFLAGGYLEARSFYASDAFSIESNQGKEYRTIHLGLDVWLPARTAVHAPLAGRIVGLHDNDARRDYGPTVILQHDYPAGHFYTLYGHLSRQTLARLSLGDLIQAGQWLAWVGDSHENGGWSPHLHFQIMHDMLGHVHDFPGACTPNESAIFADLCPDPMLLFDAQIDVPAIHDNQELIGFRHQHLGQSLSLSYSEPIQMLRGDDVYLIDQWGQKYLDTCNNVAHVGHENPRVVAAGQAQMAVLNTNSRYLHPAINQFTQALLATLPDELSVIHMVNSGSEANELAIRMAKACTGGEDIIALESGYHGNSNACINISSYKFDGKGGQGSPEKTHIVPLPDCFRGLHRGQDAGQEYASYVDKIIQKLQLKGQQLSAFIAESIVSCGGQIELPEGFLKQVYQAVRAAGGVCIADEVQVGCGRIGSHFWAFEPHDVTPDILTIGKPIGNGHPLAVVVCTRAVADRFANGMEYFNTFGGNPVSATIGHAVLNEIKNQNLQQNALKTGEYLKRQLRKMMQQHTIIKDVRGQGLFLGFELCDDKLNPLPQQAAYLANRMRELGILISTDGPDHNVIKIKPPITFNQKHADDLLNRLNTVFYENYMQ